MKRFWAGAITVAALAASGCGATSYTFSCKNRSCDLSTSGNAQVDLEDQFGETIEVTGVGDGSVTLEVGSASATIPAGGSDSVGPLQVTVKAVSGNDVKMTVED